MTRAVDLSFTCSEQEFYEFWNSASRLADELPAEKVNLDPEAEEADFEKSWNADGGRQYVTIYAHRLDGGQILVDIQTTHEMH